MLTNDPFPSEWIGWDPLFLISLRDHTTHAVVNRQKISTTTPARIGSRLVRLRGRLRHTWRLLKSPGRPANAARLHEIADAAPLLLLDGFDPPSRDGWRTVHRDLRHASQECDGGRVAIRLCVSLSASEPLSLFEQIDAEAKTSEFRMSLGRRN